MSLKLAKDTIIQQHKFYSMRKWLRIEFVMNQVKIQHVPIHLHRITQFQIISPIGSSQIELIYAPLDNHNIY